MKEKESKPRPCTNLEKFRNLYEKYDSGKINDKDFRIKLEGVIFLIYLILITKLISYRF